MFLESIPEWLYVRFVKLTQCPHVNHLSWYLSGTKPALPLTWTHPEKFYHGLRGKARPTRSTGLTKALSSSVCSLVNDNHRSRILFRTFSRTTFLWSLMSLPLGETFSGFKIQRPVQWSNGSFSRHTHFFKGKALGTRLLRTQNSLLFKHKAMRYLKSVPPRLAIAWENSRHFATPPLWPLVSPRNDSHVCWSVATRGRVSSTVLSNLCQKTTLADFRYKSLNHEKSIISIWHSNSVYRFSPISVINR